jgi:O-antigen/teichoic acid export membrane protein
VTGVPLTVGLIVCRRTYAVFKSEMVSLVLTVLLGLPLTYSLGVWGVAWGFLLTRLFSRVYLAVAFRRHVRSAPDVTWGPAPTEMAGSFAAPGVAAP